MTPPTGSENTAKMNREPDRSMFPKYARNWLGQLATSRRKECLNLPIATNPGGLAMSREAPTVDADFARLPKDRPLGDLFPGLRRLAGPIDPYSVPSSCRAAIARNTRRWHDLADVTISSIELWDMVGPHRVREILAFAEKSSESAGRASDPATDDLLKALKTIATWAIANRVDSTIRAAVEFATTGPAPTSVQAAVRLLADFDLMDLLDEGDRVVFDPMAECQRLIGQFDERDRSILERVVSRGIRQAATLAELGETFGISRERVRQLQVQVKAQLDEMLSSQSFEFLRHHVEQVRESSGAAFPVELAPFELFPTGEPLAGELFAYLAGPYQLTDGWLLRHDLPGSPSEVVCEAFETTCRGYLAPVDALLDTIEGQGVTPEFAQRMLDDVEGFRVVDGMVVRWRYLEDRIGGVLQARGIPMTSEEILEVIGGHENEQTVRNHLNLRTYAKRVSLNHWALSDWEIDEYRSVVEHMRERLLRGPRSIIELGDELAAHYEVSPASVSMYAKMHPMFIFEAGSVRLRAAEEPLRALA